MQVLQFTINGETAGLDLDAARKGRIRVVSGHLEQCDNCGDDQAYGLLQPTRSSGEFPTLACDCGETYGGKVGRGS